jgi:phosphotransferase system  glucose/maltose/N-acetylglucosamine-specific IIC component
MFSTHAISTDTWLKIMCGLMVNAMLFGVGVVTTLSIPALAEHAKYLIPAVVVSSFALTPFLVGFVARRMRIRNWGVEGWQKGDLISG